MTTNTDLYWDPFDTVLDPAPHECGADAATSGRVYRNDEYDFWALSRFADVEHAHRIPRRSVPPAARCSSSWATTWRRTGR